MLTRLKHLMRDRAPLSLLLPAYYLYCRWHYDPPHERLRRKYQLPLLAEIDLAAYKRSDTLFVLGSGSSINRISPERWRAIAAHDSAGFNFWLYHQFVPTFYFIEGASTEVQARVYLELAAQRANDYIATPKVIMDLMHGWDFLLPRLPGRWRENLFFVNTVPAISRTDEEFARVLSYLKQRDVFAPGTRLRYLFKHCATLSTMVALGVKLQYKRIVLCGIDLTTTDYYYQDSVRYPATADMTLLPRARTHPTLTRYCWGNTPIDVVLEELKHQVLDPAGIELYVEHSRSALYPKIPLAPDNIFFMASDIGTENAGNRVSSPDSERQGIRDV